MSIQSDYEFKLDFQKQVGRMGIFARKPLLDCNLTMYLKDSNISMLVICSSIDECYTENHIAFILTDIEIAVWVMTLAEILYLLYPSL